MGSSNAAVNAWTLWLTSQAVAWLAAAATDNGVNRWQLRPSTQ